MTFQPLAPQERTPLELAMLQIEAANPDRPKYQRIPSKAEVDEAFAIIESFAPEVEP